MENPCFVRNAKLRYDFPAHATWPRFWKHPGEFMPNVTPRIKTRLRLFSMSKQRSPQLEFTDCRGCGKRVATTATICHHCNTLRIPSAHSGRRDPHEEDSVDDSESALSYGGYDDHDVETEVSKNTTLSRVWWSVTWVLIIFFVLSALWPFL